MRSESFQTHPNAVDRRDAYYAEVARRRCQDNPNADPSSVNLILQFVYTHDVLETWITRYFSAHGISPSAFNVLMILRDNENRELPLHQISELLLVSRANVTGLVDCLEHRNLVERRVDERDRRVRIARLTDEGDRLIKLLLPEHHDRLRQVCKCFSEQERVTLCGLLERLRIATAEAPG